MGVQDVPYKVCYLSSVSGFVDEQHVPTHSTNWTANLFTTVEERGRVIREMISKVGCYCDGGLHVHREGNCKISRAGITQYSVCCEIRDYSYLFQQSICSSCLVS